jgi:DNA-binding LacI/PurR family transcriptional regulator
MQSIATTICKRLHFREHLSKIPKGLAFRGGEPPDERNERIDAAMTQQTGASAKPVRTLADLARIAGVSTGTVSRALSGSPLVSGDTRDKILALARDHDFTPNATARNLRTQRTGAIAVVVPLGHETTQHLSDPFFMALIGHLADDLSERGYDLLLSRVIPERPNWLQRIVDAGRADGLIIIGQSDQADVLDAVAERYLPMVAWGGYQDGQVHCSVGSDNRLGGQIATRHLVDRGCKRIAFLGNPQAVEIGHRLDGCREALDHAGRSRGPDVVPVHLTAETAHIAISEWLDGAGREVDGIFAASDIIAMSALRALAEHGRKVPDDVRVVGYDDLPLASQTSPPLTSIRQDLEAGARHLVEQLFLRMAGTRGQSVVMAPELVVRSSG